MNKILPLLALVVGLATTSCSTYDKVAVWYKYRKDYHLPKAQETAKANSTGRPGSVVAVAPDQADAVAVAETPQSEPVATAAPPEAKKMTRAERREFRRELRNEIRGMMAQAKAERKAPASPAYASTQAGLDPALQAKIDSRLQDTDPNSLQYKPDTSLRIHKATRAQATASVLAILGFILALIGFLFLGWLFGTAGLILGIIALVIGDTSLGKALAIAAIILGGIVFIYGVTAQQKK